MTNEQKVIKCLEIAEDRSFGNAEERLSLINEVLQMRDLSYIRVGQKVFWRDSEGLTSQYYTVAQVNQQEPDYVSEDDIVLLANEHSECEAYARECYMPSGNKCPRCGAPMYYSDVASYRYVCLECDENFD